MFESDVLHTEMTLQMSRKPEIGSAMHRVDRTERGLPKRTDSRRPAPNRDSPHLLWNGLLLAL